MTPLLFAAALSLSPAVAGQGQGLDLRFSFSPSPNAGEACAKLGLQTVAPDGTPMLRKLGDLPWGLVEHAVWRTVAGCPVREIVWNGQTYYLDSSGPRLESGPAVGARLARPSHSAPDDAPDAH